MKLNEFSRLGGLLKSSGLGAMAAALAMTALPSIAMADERGPGNWRGGHGNAKVHRGGGGGWRGGEGASRRQGSASGNWQARAPRPQVEHRQPQVQQRPPQMQQRQPQMQHRPPVQAQSRNSEVRQRWQDSRAATVPHRGEVRAPLTARVHGSEQHAVRRDDHGHRHGDGDGRRGYRDNRNSHDRYHDRVEDRHDRHHDRLGDIHREAHEDGLNRREHRRLHRDLNQAHYGHHDRAERRHDRAHWNREWRNDYRYDWRSYRSRYHDRYRIGRYYSPYRDWNYSRLRIGFSLAPLFYSSRYWINDPWYYRLPAAYGPYKWVRYYDDALLVDIYTGEVVDVIYDFFW